MPMERFEPSTPLGVIPPGSNPCFIALLTSRFVLLTAKLTAKVAHHPCRASFILLIASRCIVGKTWE